MRENSSNSNDIPVKRAENSTNHIDKVFPCVGDERTSQKLLIKLPSLAKDDSSCRPVFMIPGIEGAAVSMEDLAGSIHAPVLCLQHCGKHDSYHPTSIAKRLVPVR